MGAASESEEFDNDAAADPDDVSRERVARHEAVFRQANEEIRAKAAEWGMDGLLPALCECPDLHCTEVVKVTPQQYDAVRSDPRWFINAPGHHVNAHGWARVISENSRFVVVERIGEAGEQAEPTAP